MEMAVIWETLAFLVLGVGFGMGCGSYATMPYYRLPNGEACAGKWIGKKSHCPVCDAQLKTRHLIPVFNWLITRGKCYSCGTKVNPVYFFIEVSVTIFSIVSYLTLGLDQLNLHMIYVALATCLVILGATDLTYRKIPDQVLVVMVILAFMAKTPADINDMVFGLMMCVLIGVGYAKQKEEKTGEKYPHYGRLKFLGVAGLWFLPLQLALFGVLYLAFLPLVMLLRDKGEKKDDKRGLPYGVAMSLSFAVTVLVDYAWLRGLFFPADMVFF